jgi:hypothetical protein
MHGWSHIFFTNINIFFYEEGIMLCGSAQGLNVAWQVLPRYAWQDLMRVVIGQQLNMLKFCFVCDTPNRANWFLLKIANATDWTSMLIVLATIYGSFFDQMWWKLPKFYIIKVFIITMITATLLGTQIHYFWDHSLKYTKNLNNVKIESSFIIIFFSLPE